MLYELDSSTRDLATRALIMRANAGCCNKVDERMNDMALIPSSAIYY